MKIQTQTILKNFAGENLKYQDSELTIGKAISTIISTVKSVDPMRNFILGQKLYSDKEVEINQSDLDFLKKSIKENAASDQYIFTSLVTGQVLSILEQLK